MAEDMKDLATESVDEAVDKKELKRQKKLAKKNKPLKKWQQNKWLAIIYFPISFIYLEVLFHFIIFGTSGKFHVLSTIIPALFFGFLFAFLWCLISKHHVRTVLFTVLTTFIYAVFFVHVIYFAIFKTFWAPFSMMGIAGQAFDYWGVIIRNFISNLGYFGLLIIPWLIYMIFIRRIFVHPYKIKYTLINLIAAIAMFVVFFAMVFFGGRESLSPYDLLMNNGTIADRMETFGAITSSLADGICSTEGSLINNGGNNNNNNNNSPQHTVIEETGEKETETESEEKVDTSPNVLPIDFNKLISEESDPNVISMHEYYMNQPATNKNEYTGMFEGYNLIWISAEGFSSYAVSEEITPTLYSMINSGFVFNNYYSPIWYGSTSGGEWANLTGNIPNGSGSVSMVESGKYSTNLPFSPGKIFSALGYKTIGFHNNDYTYYGRDLSMPNMNYEWVATGTGYEPERHENGKALWPQSDLYMLNQTFDMYANDEPFHAYYMTISGHAEYNFGGNMMSARHKDITENLPYGTDAKAYISAQYELELFMEQLLKDLEAKGILDKTVIVLAADHVPYNYKDMCDEIAGHELDESIEWLHNSLIIWNSEMETVQVDKYCSSIDILPTVLNLFGAEYDSRLITGKDILSDTPQYVIFNSGYSFITDKCIYNGIQRTVTNLTDEEVTDDYINQIKNDISNKQKLSNLIIKYNYYDKVMNSLK